LAAAFSPPTFLAGTSQHGSDEGGVEEKERFGSDPPVDDGGTAEEAKLPDARGETPCGAHTLRPFARASDEGGRIKGAKPGETIIESAIHFVQTFCMRCQRCQRIHRLMAACSRVGAYFVGLDGGSGGGGGGGGGSGGMTAACMLVGGGSGGIFGIGGA